MTKVNTISKRLKTRKFFSRVMKVKETQLRKTKRDARIGTVTRVI